VARLGLAGISNPCTGGDYGDPTEPCSCGTSTATKYLTRISSSLLDHIATHVEVPRVDDQKLSDNRLGERLRRFEPEWKRRGNGRGRDLRTVSSRIVARLIVEERRSIR
jgi:hypothetical protein